VEGFWWAMMDQERRTGAHAASLDRDAQRPPLIVVRAGTLM
jgi:hypothetical protein